MTKVLLAEEASGSPRARPIRRLSRASLELSWARSLLADVGVLLPLALALTAVIAAVYHRFDGVTGFDFPGHLDYLRRVDFAATLPLANQGWQFYHPPAYYVMSALAFEAAHRLGWSGDLAAAGRAVATAAWVLEGGVAAAAVRLAGAGRVGMAAAAALTWLLPGQSMVGSMVYMETTTGLAEAIMVLGVLAWSRGYGWGLGLAGLGLPLAALSKFSGAVAAAATLPVLLWVGRRRLRQTMQALLPGGLVGAVFYSRNLVVFGTPTPLNAVLFHLRDWDPGARWGIPAGFFLRFDLGAAHTTLGTSCAAYDSFWGGAWKWLWATDCLSLPWRSTVGGWLRLGAVLATVASLAALAWVAVRARQEPALAVLTAVPAAVFLSFVYYVMEVPATTADKGAYLLNAIVPVAVALGLLVGRLTTRLPLAMAGYLVLVAWSADMAHASGLG